MSDVWTKYAEMLSALNKEREARERLERMLKAAAARVREQDAEINRLKEELADTELHYKNEIEADHD